MTQKEIENRIREAVLLYIDTEETYDDNAQLQIDPSTMTVTIVDSEDSEKESPAAPDHAESAEHEGEDINPEIDGMDYIDVMELVKMSSDNPGQWVADEEAISSLASEYCTE